MSASVHAGTPPPGADTPPDQADHPPREADSSIRSTSGRYVHRAGTCLMWLYSYFLECHRKGVGAFSLCISFYLSTVCPSGPPWNEGQRAQRFVTRPVSLRSLKTGTTQIPFLLVLYLFIALVRSTTVSLVYMSVHYKVVHNTFVCRALHALGRAAPTLGAPQSLGWAAPRFC